MEQFVYDRIRPIFGRLARPYVDSAIRVIAFAVVVNIGVNHLPSAATNFKPHGLASDDDAHRSASSQGTR